MPDVVYGRHPVQEALRGRRRVREIATNVRGADAAWLADAGVPTRVASREELDALAGSPDHQGVVARVDAIDARDHALVVGAARQRVELLAGGDAGRRPPRRPARRRRRPARWWRSGARTRRRPRRAS